MECPVCHHPKTVVTETRQPTVDAILRHRRCVACRHRWRTVEAVSSDIGPFTDVIRWTAEAKAALTVVEQACSRLAAVLNAAPALDGRVKPPPDGPPSVVLQILTRRAAQRARRQRRHHKE